ncbi:hypothetical protein B7P43_G01927 [Cryptotermes secundus]|uniref:Hexosyltransferase n=1 Tax=Cryptotermes secundus TaxID=105785 RepID=A0A2J7QLW6_9NEOP|nr:hypothetical protein B7P43_G01927 [Cryptotermes secundus]
MTDIAIFAVLIITSHAGDIEARSAMRRAYPEDKLKHLGIRRIFLLAVSNPKDDVRYNSVTQNALEDENHRYSDLVQGNFREAYRNLTYKHMMGLDWVTKYCQQAQPLLMGYLLQGTRPVREPANKWFVTQSEFPGSMYPPFLSVSKTVHYFWIDDTYVTGLLAQVAGISHQDIHQYFTLHSEYLECCIQDKIHLCDYIVGPNGGDPVLLLRFQRHAASCQERKCPQRSPDRALNRTCVAPKKFSAPSQGHGEVKPVPLF